MRVRRRDDSLGVLGDDGALMTCVTIGFLQEILDEYIEIMSQSHAKVWNNVSKLPKCEVKGY